MYIIVKHISHLSTSKKYPLMRESLMRFCLVSIFQTLKGSDVFQAFMNQLIDSCLPMVCLNPSLCTPAVEVVEEVQYESDFYLCKGNFNSSGLRTSVITNVE